MVQVTILITLPNLTKPMNQPTMYRFIIRAIVWSYVAGSCRVLELLSHLYTREYSDQSLQAHGPSHSRTLSEIVSIMTANAEPVQNQNLWVEIHSNNYVGQWRWDLIAASRGCSSQTQRNNIKWQLYTLHSNWETRMCTANASRPVAQLLKAPTS